VRVVALGVSLVLLVDAPYTPGQQVVDRESDSPVESSIAHSPNIGLVGPGFKARFCSVPNPP
jgi:hypothetical protein